MEGACGRKGGVWAITLDLDDRPSLDSRARVLFVFVVHAMQVNGCWVKHIPPHACRLTVQVFIVTARRQRCVAPARGYSDPEALCTKPYWCAVFLATS